MGDPNQYQNPNMPFTEAGLVTEPIPVASHELVAQAALEVSRHHEDVARDCDDNSLEQLVHERIAMAFMDFAKRLEPS